MERHKWKRNMAKKKQVKIKKQRLIKHYESRICNLQEEFERPVFLSYQEYLYARIEIKLLREFIEQLNEL